MFSAVRTEAIHRHRGREVQALRRGLSPLLPSRLLELVVGMDEVLARQRLVALEARGELNALVGLLVRHESAILPFAIAERVGVFTAPTVALLHRVEAEHFAFDEAPIGAFDGIALRV